MTCTFKIFYFYHPRCWMPLMVVRALWCVCLFNNLVSLPVLKRQTRLLWKIYDVIAVGKGRSWFTLISVCEKFYYYMRKGLDLWPYKVMFWGMKMTTLITNQGTILGSYTLTLLPEPTPKRIHIKWVWHDYTMRLNYQSFFCKVQLNLVFETINGLPGLSSSVLQLYFNFNTVANIHRCYNK
jgi:hypothetical protein